MANATLFQAFTVGKDMSLTIRLLNVQGSVIANSSDAPLQFDIATIGLLENFHAVPQHIEHSAKTISNGGRSIFRDTFGHWEGGFNILRTGPSGDLMLQVLQDALLSSLGGSVLCELEQTVYDPLGQPSGKQVYTYTEAVLSPAGGGEYNADNPVVHQFKFRCPERVLTSANNPTLTGDAAVSMANLDIARNAIK